MKNEFIGIRVPQKLKRAIERERKRMSRAVGAEVQTSAVVRALLERALTERSKPSSEAA